MGGCSDNSILNILPLLRGGTDKIITPIFGTEIEWISV